MVIAEKRITLCIESGRCAKLLLAKDAINAPHAIATKCTSENRQNFLIIQKICAVGVRPARNERLLRCYSSPSTAGARSVLETLLNLILSEKAGIKL